MEILLSDKTPSSAQPGVEAKVLNGARRQSSIAPAVLEGGGEKALTNSLFQRGPAARQHVAEPTRSTEKGDEHTGTFDGPVNGLIHFFSSFCIYF